MSDPADQHPNDESDITDSTSAQELYEAMEPLEPYTTGELASLLDVPRQFARKLLEALTGDEQIRRKEPDTGSDSTIWIRPPPIHECPNCGRQFEINYLHTVLSAVRFCPRCGTRIN